jgi:PAS domain S-box-containing protein
MSEEIDERAIFVRGPVVVFRWRNEPGWPVEYVSPNATEVFGHSPAAFSSGAVPYASLIHPDDAERVGREVGEASASDAGSFVHQPYRVRHADGRTIWLYDFTHVLRDESGAVTHYLGYVIDITPRIEAEEQARELERRLLHAQKLESLGLLAGGVAHDFNNLLTGMLGQASLARRRLSGSPSPAAEAVEQIEHLARRAADLTRQLLAYSGRGSFVIEPVDLGDVVREIVDMLGVAVPRNATLRLDLAAGLPTIDADRTQMHQIAMNLLGNAGEALGGAPGRVTLRTFVEECTEERLRDVYARTDRAPGAYVVLEVEDTGCGMQEDVRARLFDPFFTTKGAGRGLGMSAVDGIVRGHAGLLHVASEPGRGTTFRVLFPASGAPAASPVVAPEPPAAHPTGGVLVVDDDSGIRVTLRLLLKHLGYEVHAASGGAEALAMLDVHGPNLVAVLLDLTMPGLSGHDTLSAMLARAPDLPIVLMSGFSEADFASAPGAAGFLQKPYGVDELERALTTGIAAKAAAARG